MIINSILDLLNLSTVKSCFVIAAPRGMLGAPCHLDNTCISPNTLCMNGMCICKHRFFKKAGLCGKLTWQCEPIN